MPHRAFHTFHIFQTLGLVIVCAGLLFTAIFQIFTPEGKSDKSYLEEHDETLGLLTNDQSKDSSHTIDVQKYKTDQSEDTLFDKEMTWIDWLKELQFYQVRISIGRQAKLQSIAE